MGNLALGLESLYKISFEQAVLTALMTINGSIESLPAGFDRHVFFAERHQLIYAAICALDRKNQPYDATMVFEEIKDNGTLELAGGEPYLLQLLAESPASLYNIGAYADKLVDLAARRQALNALDTARSHLLSNPDSPAQEVIAGAVAGALESCADNADSESDVKELMRGFIHNIENPNPLKRGYHTGFEQLTNTLNGLRAGQLIVVGARPGLGKTTLAMNIADGVMADTGKQVLFFSMEMEKPELMERYMSSVTGVPLHNIRSGQLSDEQRSEIFRKSAVILQERKLTIDDQSKRAPHQIMLTARRAMRKAPVGLIVVDYLQLMTHPEYRENRFQEISAISRDLKAMAKDLGCPVLALAQLNREAAKPGVKPRIDHMGESGQIERDADVILLLHRDEIEKNDDAPPEHMPGETELIIAKHRNGPKGTIKLIFEASCSRYVEKEAYSAGGHNDF